MKEEKWLAPVVSRYAIAQSNFLRELRALRG